MGKYQIDLLQLHKYFIRNHLHEGDIAVDYTMGNGHDTEFLSKTVGPTGHVYAFDIQEQALESTARHLQETGCPENYTLIRASHQFVKDYVHTPVKAGMFNLGWLPGGDKSVTTLRESTMPAIRAAIELMDTDAILNVAVYPGHAEGQTEGKMLLEKLAGYDKKKFCVSHFHLVNSPDAPFVIAVEKYDKAENRT